MQVKLQNISKKFKNHTVFKNVNLTFNSGFTGVVLGGNGSGKSTLLKVISTALVPSTGQVVYTQNNTPIAEHLRYKNVAFCAPYTDLIEDFTLRETISFQNKFRPFLPGISTNELVKITYLERFQNEPLKTYSSGMRQRVKLAMAITANTPILLLDEPTSNLDPAGKKWYQELIEKYAHNRTIIVGSNFDEAEYFFAKEQIKLKDFQ